MWAGHRWLVRGGLNEERHRSHTLQCQPITEGVQLADGLEDVADVRAPDGGDGGWDRHVFRLNACRGVLMRCPV
jgi:hypothetical protein